MEALKSLQGRIDALSLRERGIILGAILLFVYFLFYTFVMEPIAASQKIVQNQIIQTNAEIAALNVQMQKTLAASPDRLQAKNEQEVQRLRQERASIDQQLQEATASLVKPEQMAKLLQMVLASTDGLRLGKVTSLGSTRILINDKSVSAGNKTTAKAENEPAANENSLTAVYKHGLQIQFDGDFFATLEYLRELEQLDSKFFWDNIKFEMNEYPDATSTLTLYTISLNKNWIGV